MQTSFESTGFESITIKNYQEMLEVFDLLVNLFNDSEVELITNNFEFDTFLTFLLNHIDQALQKVILHLMESLLNL